MNITALQRLVNDTLDDLQRSAREDAALAERVREAWQEATRLERTGETLTVWREEQLTQVAVAWVLTLVFVRYLEAHGLVEPVLVGEVAMQRQRAFFQQPERRADSDTDYLLDVFATLAEAPAGELFGAARNPLYKVRISGDQAMALLAKLREVDTDTGALALDFAEADTRFLGDLYQDLSELARKRYALLQTPDFVESFILDLTLEPAIEAFGLDAVRFIDPTCGSGHFLLGGFRRLYDRRRAARPDAPALELVREALAATHGVDINPFAVAIARFRLTVEALKLCGAARWHDAPHLPLRVAVGDSLLLGDHFQRFETGTTAALAQQEIGRHVQHHELATEDADLLLGDPATDTPGILTQQYHAVVGNPPYINVSDKALTKVYRETYVSASGRYALVCPFVERFFSLALGDRLGDSFLQCECAGFVGMIVANSFAKRAFGKSLVEEVIPCLDITYVIDTSNVLIPGHGTPTVVVCGRNQEQSSGVVRTVLGIRKESVPPDVPSMGKVWLSIVNNVYAEFYENDFVTIFDCEKAFFNKHPWSLKGGGVLECKDAIENEIGRVLVDFCNVGISGQTNADDVLVNYAKVFERGGVDRAWLREYVEGECVRDWMVRDSVDCLYPYRGERLELVECLESSVYSYLWPYRTMLWGRAVTGKQTYREVGKEWFSWHRMNADRYSTKYSLLFPFVSTHNHFVLDRGGKVFKQTAPVIKLPADATLDDHLELLGLLNSSTVGFWLKTMLFARNTMDEEWRSDFEHDSTKVGMTPIPTRRPLALARHLDTLAQEAGALEPSALVSEGMPTLEALDAAREAQAGLFGRMVAMQEELDWWCYEAYGLLKAGAAPLVDEPRWGEVPEVRLGERAFEIVMARKMAAGDLVTTWFERHGSTPVTEAPEHWPQWYREVVEARVARILDKKHRFIRLVEQPQYKRRWNRDGWAEREAAALTSWLLDRLESPAYVPQADRQDEAAQATPGVVTARELADVARRDEAFMRAGERLTGDPSFDVDRLVANLVVGESAPFLPTQRYKPKGLALRKEWEQVWAMQRAEDAIDARARLPDDHPDHLSAPQAAALKASEIGDIPAPPKYTSAAFRTWKASDLKQLGARDVSTGAIYTLRGKLDVPRERFILLEGCHRDDGSPALIWAGLDHRQQAMALAGYYNQTKLVEGWGADRLSLLLAGLLDLLPWVKQWHNDLDELTATRLGDFLEVFIESEARELGLSLDAIERLRIG